MLRLRVLLVTLALLQTHVIEAEVGQGITPISGAIYESALNSLLQTSADDKTADYYHLQLRFLPSFGVESQIELSCGPELEGKVDIFTLSQSLKAFLQEHPDSHQQTSANLRSMINVARKRVNLPCFTIQANLEEFWKAVRLSTLSASQIALSDAANNKVTVALDPFTYDITYSDNFYNLRFTLAGVDPSDPSIKRALPITQWAVQIRKKFMP